ncbi:hypothetical protein [Sphingomonas morindae]|uniref:Uncharacterized protein n=1 Tax=Sphingomonas morindae TaxID=1541170 RepID=A0ABY4X9H9_9SPHN|nr:hypothetical protein [Sphingomonas morindae]USI73548.1 hypothetical protein LHA26_03440 [Sphingomonas morindae]
MLVLLASLLFAAHTPRPRVALSPLPAAVHVDGPMLVQLRSEPGHPIFSPSRSNAPIGDAGAAPAAPLPVLTGIAMGGARPLALVKDQKGTTAILHVGDVVDGWTVRAITNRSATFERTGESHEVELTYAAPAAGSAHPPASPDGSSQ